MQPNYKKLKTILWLMEIAVISLTLIFLSVGKIVMAIGFGIVAVSIIPSTIIKVGQEMKRTDVVNRIARAEAQGLAYCPKCGSTSLSANQKGFGVGKAVVGAKLTGSPLGLAAGNIGRGRVKITCLNCGHKFYPG